MENGPDGGGQFDFLFATAGWVGVGLVGLASYYTLENALDGMVGLRDPPKDDTGLFMAMMIGLTGSALSLLGSARATVGWHWLGSVGAGVFYLVSLGAHLLAFGLSDIYFSEALILFWPAFFCIGGGLAEWSGWGRYL